MHKVSEVRLDSIDRRVLNTLQDGFPICDRPFAVAGEQLGLSEDDLIARLRRLLDAGVLSRFGPMYRVERGGGAVALAALAVPAEQLQRVADFLNALPEVAHNYERAHAFNLWFVLAVESDAALNAAVERIEQSTGYEVLLLPKEEEYFLDLRFEL